MVEAYSAMATHMPDNGFQIVMFTHQDAGVARNEFHRIMLDDCNTAHHLECPREWIGENDVS